MCNRSIGKRLWLLGLLSLWGATTAVEVSAQEVLYLYGPSGPSPAIRDAAAVFGEQHNVKVEVVAGPASTWLDKARGNADLIYSSAEFMMSSFIRTTELQIDEDSVTPLYLRPSAILVRPGNPKGIGDFPDLLRSEVKLMVVIGSGQTGLWEDMAGKLGDIRTLRALRKNIVFFAANSDEAMKTWQEREDIDAWLTWNIWFMPLRDHAAMVPVSRDYRVYRQCSIALTQRGRTKPLAVQFTAFLTSPEGAGIFDSWGWMVPPAASNSLVVHSDICAVCRIDSDEWKDNVGMGLACVRGLLKDYETVGIPSNEVHINAVFHGAAAYWMLKDGPYASFTKRPGPNPNKSIIHELVRLGVSLELCAQTMEKHGWTKGDILPGVKIVAGAYPRIIDLEHQGYAYIRF